MTNARIAAGTAAAALMVAGSGIDLTMIGGFRTENPYAFAAVTGRRKNKATGDRPLNRSKYTPHQGVAECARRRQRRAS